MDIENSGYIHQRTKTRKKNVVLIFESDQQDSNTLISDKFVFLKW